MCGIIAFAGRRPAAAPLLAGLSFLQHRGQDACGVATIADGRILRRRGSGLLREVFSQADATDLRGEMGIGHVRYPTAGGAFVESEAQPLYVNQPFGMVLAHNGNIVNAAQLRARLAAEGRRHINSDSDSEVLLNLLANLIAAKIPSARREIAPDIFFDAVAQLHAECVGAYAVVVAVAGQGILAFRDPCGIRPLCLAAREGKNGAEWLIASESVVQRPLGFDAVADIGPGEAVFIDSGGELHRRSCAVKPLLAPCLFEFIYFARPDSVLDGASVYAARLEMGRRLAAKIARENLAADVDCIVPVPDSARPAAMELASSLSIPYREGLVKNRYVGRTFLMAGQGRRRNSVREKLNVIAAEFRGKSVMLVDDSVVRGTTGREIARLAAEAGARKIVFASAAPPVRFPNVYGIDMPTTSELLAAAADEGQIAAQLGVERVIYQTIEDIEAAVSAINPALTRFDGSCFSGEYVTGGVDEAYLRRLAAARGAGRDEEAQLDLTLRPKPQPETLAPAA